MKGNLIVYVIFIFSCNLVYGQTDISGIVFSESGKQAIEYVNIGIAGKNIGTVTNEKGEYRLIVEPQHTDDLLLFSCIGYETFSCKIAELEKMGDVYLKEKTYNLDQVIIKPRIFKEELLGVKTKSKRISAGFEHNMLGYECGIRMYAQKSAILKKVAINIARCSYDTIFYRLNVYKVSNEMDFINILQKPIYISASSDILQETFSINLEPYDIIIDGDFLVTLEHIKELGEGALVFCADKKHKTYFRKTSQGEWQMAPVGISISVVADIEK